MRARLRARRSRMCSGAIVRSRHVSCCFPGAYFGRGTRLFARGGGTFCKADSERTATMTKRFNPPSAHRVSAVAIAAALAAFASVAGAQSTQPRAGTADSPRAATASAAAGATGAPAAARALPGYAQSSNGQVVLNGFGTCVRAGHWAPQHAAEPCDRIAVARLEPPPVPVAAAPEPKLEPAPAPVPAPLAVVEPAEPWAAGRPGRRAAGGYGPGRRARGWCS